MSRASNFSWPVACILFIGLPAAYLGAYYGMLDHTTVRPVVNAQGLLEMSVVPVYRLPGDFVEGFILPANAMDRRIRRDNWKDNGKVIRVD